MIYMIKKNKLFSLTLFEKIFKQEGFYNIIRDCWFIGSLIPIRNTMNKVNPQQNKYRPQKGLPLYLQVTSWLREDIANKTYPVGSILPTTHELAAMLGVGKHTVREALAQLKNVGLVSIRKRGGTRVEANLAETSGFVLKAFDSVTQYSAIARLQLIQKDLIIARKEVAELLQCPPAQDWLYIEGYRAGGNPTRPIGYSEIFINRDFPIVYERINKNTRVIFKMFGEIYDEDIIEVRQEMRTVLINARAAEILDVKEGELGMRYITRFFSAKGEQLEVAVNIHPLDKIDYARHIVYPRSLTLDE